MTHSHSGSDTTRSATPSRGRSREPRRHRRALRILVVVLIPLGIWTFAGLIALWPGDVSSHVNAEVAGYSIAGRHLPVRADHRHPARSPVRAGRLHARRRRRPAAPSPRAECSTATTRARRSPVPLTDALYSTGIEVGQRVTLIRIPPLDGQPAQYQFSDFERRYAAAGDHPRLRGGGDLRRALARLRVPARSGVRRFHPGQVHVPGPGRRLQPAAGRADRHPRRSCSWSCTPPTGSPPGPDGPGRHPVRTGRPPPCWAGSRPTGRT